MTEPYHDVRGAGPVLLIMPGGAGHPMGLEPLVEALAARCTVVTYDPLGLAHGRLGLPVADQRAEEWSDGARRVLDEVLAEGETAHVLGTSSGGIAALDLLARHPERLRHVIAHEPPCVSVLPDGAELQAKFREVYGTYRAAGLQAAGAHLGAVLAERTPEASPQGRPLSREEELTHPMALFLGHVLRQFTSHPLDLTALPAARLTLAAGSESRGQLLYRTAEFVADRTGSDFVEFPGGHVGAVQHPAAFAAALMKAFRLG
ncbi:alpha/beta hydrolase [Streptomyces sp. Act143]|uniref:alpha/beta fold hydrolase n=1 Tax=Streptomyces sp. Act143 TaxID=2200760 RepID=UPI000D6833FC|nr:alpha/beta fold hydrolase [Streptomyces sp. Act143]PWI14606.1 alpha/beta hydrolase [Streptomyces sp. Act143]